MWFSAYSTNWTINNSTARVPTSSSTNGTNGTGNGTGEGIPLEYVLFWPYYLPKYIADQINTEFAGIISGVTEWGIYVEIVENKCEGMIRLRDIDDDFYVLDQANYCIIGQRKKRKYQLGDEVKIKVRKVDLAKKQIDFQLITDSLIHTEYKKNYKRR